MKKILLTLFLFSFTFPLFSQAGGTISREEMLEKVCAETEAICSALQEMNLADFGSAARAGGHAPNPGERVMPFEFEAFTYNLKIIRLTIDHDESGKVFIKTEE